MKLRKERYTLKAIQAALLTKPQEAKVSIEKATGNTWINAAIKSEAECVRSAREGKRNSTLNRAAFKLGQIVGANASLRQSAGASSDR